MPEIDTTNQPTDRLYRALTEAKDYFNQNLFDNQLGPCLLTVQRKNRAYAYFSPKRWKDTQSGDLVHEIAVNPAYFASCSLLHVLSALVHEQVHQWQEEYGKPSRRTYHNKEFADKMESIGLVTSSTGGPGGKRVGQLIHHYVLKSGRFFQCAKDLSESGYFLPLIDRAVVQNDVPMHLEGEEADRDTIILNPVEDENRHNPDDQEQAGAAVDTDHTRAVQADPESLKSSPEDDVLTTTLIEQQGEGADVVEQTPEKKRQASKSKVKFTCPECKCNAWGKPSLQIGCLACNQAMVAQQPSPPKRQKESALEKKTKYKYLNGRIKKPENMEQFHEFITEFVQVAKDNGASVYVEGLEYSSPFVSSRYEDGGLTVRYKAGAADISCMDLYSFKFGRKSISGLDGDGEPIKMFY